MTRDEKITIGILIFPGFPMACLTSMIEPLRAANEIAGAERFGWTLISETGARTESSAGVAFDPDAALSEVEGLDYLFLLSSPGGSFDDARSGNGKLRALMRFGVRVGAISGGIFPLTRAGLSDAQHVSVHWCYRAAYEAEFPDARMSDEVIVVDGRLFTASGASAAFDLALMLIREEFGQEVSTEVACWFQHPLMRTEGVRQTVPALGQPTGEALLPDCVAAAVQVFNRHLEDPIRVADVADEIGVSPRQLERSFKKFTGKSPLFYYRSVRMKAVRQLVMYSSDSITGIAATFGYSSASRLKNHYKDVFGISPMDDRKRINLLRVESNAPVPAA